MYTYEDLVFIATGAIIADRYETENHVQFADDEALTRFLIDCMEQYDAQNTAFLQKQAPAPDWQDTVRAALAEYFKDDLTRFDGTDIHVNFETEILFSESGDRPEAVATVDLGLIDTRALTSIIDAQRTEKGFLPMLPNDDEYDENGWYDFYISLNDQSCTRVDAKITAIVQSEAAPDDKACYEIELTEAEQRLVFDSIDYDLQNETEKTAEEYLALARQYLEENRT